MSNFYHITKKQAKDIGVVQLSKGFAFDPNVGETTMGFYLVEESVYNQVKDTVSIDVSRSKLSNQISLRQVNMASLTNSDWKNLSQDFFYNSTIMTKILSSANPNGYSTMLKVLTDGENNYASEAAFLQVFGMLGISWTQAEKDIINGILTDNNFTIQIL